MSRRLPEDWFPRELPAGLTVGQRSFLISSYAFLHAAPSAIIRIGSDTGIYHGTFFELGPAAHVEIGDYCTLVGAIMRIDSALRIGNCALIATKLSLRIARLSVRRDPFPHARLPSATTRGSGCGRSFWQAFASAVARWSGQRSRMCADDDRFGNPARIVRTSINETEPENRRDGTFGNVPYAGMAWMHCQFLVGLARLGHEVCYVETTTAWPYHPINMTTTDDPTYTIDYLRRVLDEFGLGERWAYRAALRRRMRYGPGLAGRGIDQIG